MKGFDCLSTLRLRRGRVHNSLVSSIGFCTWKGTSPSVEYKYNYTNRLGREMDYSHYVINICRNISHCHECS